MEVGRSDARAPKLLEDWVAHWSSHDLEKLFLLYTDDLAYEDVSRGTVHHGKAELKAFADRFYATFPDVRFDLNSGFIADDRAGAEWTMTGTHRGDLPGIPATGNNVAIRGATIFELVAGKIHRSSDYWDTATLLKQLGVPPG